jgi:hypothetical protein
MSAHRIRNADGILLEAGWQRQVVELAQLGGWAVFHAPDNRPGRRTGRPQAVVGDSTGFPDLVLVRGCELLAVELKTDKGRLGPGQPEWLDRFTKVGEAVRRIVARAALPPSEPEPLVESHLWRPRDIDAVQARLVGPMSAVGDVTDDMGEAA